MTIPPDLELFLCGWLKERLTDVDGLQVGNRPPESYRGQHPLIVIRDDGGAMLGLGRFDRSVGVTVYGWTRSNSQPCMDLARRVMGLLTDQQLISPLGTPGSPVESVTEDGCNGPYATTDDLDTAAVYMTVEYTVTGQW